MDISLARVAAAAAGITEIGQRQQSLLFYTEALRAGWLRPLLAALPGRVRLQTTGRPCVQVDLAPGEKPLDALRTVLGILRQPAGPQA
mgnify:CR=1 FL=1